MSRAWQLPKSTCVETTRDFDELLSKFKYNACLLWMGPTINSRHRSDEIFGSPPLVRNGGPAKDCTSVSWSRHLLITMPNWVITHSPRIIYLLPWIVILIQTQSRTATRIRKITPRRYRRLSRFPWTGRTNVATTNVIANRYYTNDCASSESAFTTHHEGSGSYTS